MSELTNDVFITFDLDAIDPSELPEEWRDYDSVDSVVLDSSDASKLSAPQRSALSRWTLLGGRVTLVDRDRISDQPVQSPHGLGSFGMVAGFQRPSDAGAPDFRASLIDVDQEIFEAQNNLKVNKIPEAVQYLDTLPAIKGAVIGVSKESHARDTFRFLSKNRPTTNA
jgi:hypothetical protein